MSRLSSPIQDIKPSYDVVVVGSGYGGGIAASRLARAGRTVCLLERGREFAPGDFPETELATLAQFQLDAPQGHVGSQAGLFDVRVNPDIAVIVGCGLGGTSLINASVALRPDQRVFQREVWPRALAADIDGLTAGYAHAEEMLRPRAYPEDWPALPKMQAHEESARALGRPFRRVPLNVSFEDGTNHVGVEQKKCILCGNCVTGCNHRSKSTVAMNYLPDARAHGAEIFTGARVRRIEKREGGWLVHYQAIGSGQEKYDAPTQFVRAAIVVLAAGALGSTEILLRSAGHGLPLSHALGRRFTGNGDMLAFAYNCRPDANSIGWSGDRAPAGQPPVGPTITSMIDLRGDQDAQKNVILEEGAIPAGLGRLTTDAMAALAAIKHELRGPSAPATGRTVEDAGRASQTYLVMVMDDDRGHMLLEDDRLRVSWPDVGKQDNFLAGNAVAWEAADAIGGTYLRDPLWTKELGERLVTVHPLGGCVMADNADRGVVNDRCQVFAGPSGTGVHEGLYVCDGAVIPTPLGVNPLLTISALAERACHLLAQDRGWHIDYTLPLAITEAVGEDKAPVGLQFSERMKGAWKRGVTDDYERGAREGEAAGSSFSFTLTIVAEDLDAMLQGADHAAELFGTATAPALSDQPLTVTDGTFNLFSRDPTQPDYRFMHYRMRLTDVNGRAYWFHGWKRMGHNLVTAALHDSTTLFVTLHDGENDSAPVLGKGILTIGVEDIARLASSIQALRARGFFEQRKAELRFAQFFLGSLATAYLPQIVKW